MSTIRAKDTKPELVLGKKMWRIGLRYRKHYKIYGKPDFVFVTARVAVFCDGDFWHGRHFRKQLNEGRFDNDRSFWENKMRRNRERDKDVKKQLMKQGWVALRFWETEILQNSQAIANQIKKAVTSRATKFG